MTPAETDTPLVTAVCESAYTRLRERLGSKGVRITTGKNRFRITPSVFNDSADIEKFLGVLGRAQDI